MCCLCGGPHMCVACHERAARPDPPRLTDEQMEAFYKLAMEPAPWAEETRNVVVVPDGKLPRIEVGEVEVT